MTTTFGGPAPRRPLDTAARVAVETDRQQIAEFYRAHYEKAAIQQIERQLEGVHQQLADYYARHYAELVGQQVDARLYQERVSLEEQRRNLEASVLGQYNAELNAQVEALKGDARRKIEIERIKIEAEFDRQLEAAEDAANRQVEIERMQVEAEFDRKLDFVGAEAERQVEEQRLRLEAEMQQRLDQVGAEVDAIEAINARAQKRLKRGLAFSLLALIGVAAGAAAIFLTRVQPENQRLRTMAEQILSERGRQEQKIRDQDDALRRNDEQMKSLRGELEQARKAVSMNTASALPSATPAAPTGSPPPQGKASLGAAGGTPVSAVSSKRAHHAGSDSSDSIARPAKGGPCKCAPSDPLCGCLN